MKNNAASISPEERLFQVIKGGAVGIRGREIETKGYVSLFSYLKRYKFYLLTVLFLIAVFFPCYYFLNAGLNKGNVALKSNDSVKSAKEDGSIEKNESIEESGNIVSDILPVKDATAGPVKESEVTDKVVLARDLVENLYLVGIAWGDEPRAMIENKESGKTFFLRRGESFYRFRVGKILIDRVVLECKGEKFELM